MQRDKAQGLGGVHSIKQEAVSSQQSAAGKSDGALRGPPLLFKVEKVLGVHTCPLSKVGLLREFI